MTSVSGQHRAAAVHPLSHRLPVRVRVVWDVACDGLALAPRAIRDLTIGQYPRSTSARLVAFVELCEPDAASVTLYLEPGESVVGTTVLVASMPRASVLRDHIVGLMHVDAADDVAQFRMTLRTCRDGVTLLYAWSSVFERFGVPGGRVEPPLLRDVE